MKQYEFKTISPQFNRMPTSPNRNFVIQPPPVQVGFISGREQRIFSNQNQPRQQQPIRTLPPMSVPAAQSSPELMNLPNMKKQLQNLLKQTQFLESKSGQHNLSYTVTETRTNNFNSLDKTTKTDFNRLPSRSERQQNYQKYQKILQQPNNSQRISAPLQSNKSFNDVNSSFNNSYSNQSASSPQNYLKNNNVYEFTQSRPQSKPFLQQTGYNIEKNSNNYFKTASDNQNFNKDIIKSPTNTKTQNPQKSYNFHNYQENKFSQRLKTSPSLATNNSYENKIQSYENLTSPTNKTNYNKYEDELDFTSKNSEKTNKPKQTTPVLSALQQELKIQNKLLISIQKSQNQQITQLYQKISKLQTENSTLQQNIKKHKKNQQLYEIQKKNSDYQVKLLHDENQQKIKEVKSHYQIQIQHIKVLNNQAKKKYQLEIQELKKTHQVSIHELNNQIQKKQQNMISLVKQIKSYDTVKSSAQKSLSASQILSLQNDQIQQLKTELQRKQVDINNLQNQLNSRQQHIKLLNQTFLELKDQIEDLKIFKKSVQTEHYSNFDQILITQMHTISELKNNMQNMSDRSNQLKLSLIQAQRKNQALENQIKIMQLKHRSQLSSINTQAEIQIGHRDNQIGTLNKKMQTLEQKLRYSTNEAKRKDDFVKQYLVGRAQSVDAKQHIENVLSKYQQTFSQSSQAQLRGELEKAHKQIQLYQKYA